MNPWWLVAPPICALYAVLIRDLWRDAQDAKRLPR